MSQHPLAVAATVGAANRAIDYSVFPAELRPVLGDDAAENLLDAAVLHTLAERTVPPTAAASVPTPPPAETRPVVSDTVRQVLERTMKLPALLAEALELINAHGERLPAELVPVLLDDGRAEIVPLVRAVFGNVGEWLLEKNPRWKGKNPPDSSDPATWKYTLTSRRVPWLQGLRHNNPAAMTALLMAELESESATERATYLALLSAGLSLGDEELLMRHLGDRSPTVVTIARDLLVRIPGSALRRELEAALVRHVTRRRKLLRSELEITELAPDELGAWPVAATLADVIARVDPADWDKLVGFDLLSMLVARPELWQQLRPALIQAAATFHHEPLALALLPPTLVGKTAHIDPGLWGALSPARAIAVVLDMIDQGSSAPLIRAAAFTISGPWPAALSFRFTEVLAGGMQRALIATKSEWEAWASLVAPTDCNAAADLARQVAAQARSDQTDPATSSLVHTRAAAVATTLTLRAVLFNAYAQRAPMTYPAPHSQENR